MKIVRYALVGAAALAIAACGSNEEDTLTNVEDMQAEDLNALADDAMMDAENEALGTELPVVETPAAEPETAPAEDAVSTEPSEVEDDVQGM